MRIRRRTDRTKPRGLSSLPDDEPLTKLNFEQTNNLFNVAPQLPLCHALQMLRHDLLHQHAVTGNAELNGINRPIHLSALPLQKTIETSGGSACPSGGNSTTSTALDTDFPHPCPCSLSTPRSAIPSSVRKVALIALLYRAAHLMNCRLSCCVGAR